MSFIYSFNQEKWVRININSFISPVFEYLNWVLKNLMYSRCYRLSVIECFWLLWQHDVYCLQYTVYSLLHIVYCPLSDVNCHMPDVQCLISNIRLYMSDVSCQIPDVICYFNENYHIWISSFIWRKNSIQFVSH